MTQSTSTDDLPKLLNQSKIKLQEAAIKSVEFLIERLSLDLSSADSREIEEHKYKVQVALEILKITWSPK